MKYVLVTGAYGGMGSVAVKEFVANGYTVFALDKNVKEAEDNVIPIKVDVSDSDSINLAFEKVKEITEELYAIVHFAGVYALNSLIEISDEDFERVFKINFFGAFYVNKAFMPLLKRGGRIVMITSELAPLNPLPFTGIYAIAKSTLDKYAFSLKMELQLLDVFVSVLRAGAVSTNMLNVSTRELDKFCDSTTLYECNAKRFKKIVNSVEAKSISPKKLAIKTLRILSRKKPKFIYNINRNKLLLLLNTLPKTVQFFAIKKILKNKQ